MSDENTCVCGEPLATCPHLGDFATWEEKFAHYKGKPAREAALENLAEVGRKAGALRDRLFAADLAHDVGHVAEDLGVDLPYRDELVGAADAVASFGPLAGHLPFIANNPAAKTALDVMVEAARLLLRAIRGK